MYIFLDIDGVLVPAKSWERPILLEDGFSAFSARAVAMLRDLIPPGATVLLTTSHKSRYSAEEWKEIFRKRGIILPEVELLPENTSGRSRKEEILQWLSARPTVDNYIILDDDTSLNDLPPPIKKKLVLLHSLIGLTEEHRTIINEIIQAGRHPQ